MTRRLAFAPVVNAGLIFVAGALFSTAPLKLLAQQGSPERAGSLSGPRQRQFLDRYCVTCHNERQKTAELNLSQADLSRIGEQAEMWEKVVRKLHTRTMPPPSMRQPPEAERLAMLMWLETSLDAASAAKPNPGRTEALRHLNGTEYQNAIRDLLALDIDAASLLPADESGHGFDNVTVRDISATLLKRYVGAAQKISRLAVGSPQSDLQSDTFSVPPDLTQEYQLPGMPLGTRGGISTSYTFPQNGEYDIQILLARNLEGVVSGLRDSRTHQLLVLVDREPAKTFMVQKAADGDDTRADKDLKTRIPVSAGPHKIAVTFIQEGSSLIDTLRQPTESRFNDRRHPRSAPGIAQVSITGPYAPNGAADTPSRRRLFTCRPAGQGQAAEEKCAVSILSTVMRRAYRRPVLKIDVDEVLLFYRKGRTNGDFEAGVTSALSAILSNPEFLLHLESDPKELPPGGAYKITDLELASRLSFFLWSSIPDDELLDAAIDGKQRNSRSRCVE